MPVGRPNSPELRQGQGDDEEEGKTVALEGEVASAATRWQMRRGTGWEQGLKVTCGLPVQAAEPFGFHS